MKTRTGTNLRLHLFLMLTLWVPNLYAQQVEPLAASKAKPILRDTINTLLSSIINKKTFNGIDSNFNAIGKVLERSEAPCVGRSHSIKWKRCSNPGLAGLECATFTVPKDYSDFTAGTFDLAVVRSRATGRSGERIGSLFVNLGGPGVPVMPFVSNFIGVMPAEIRKRFDIVIWEPRGVGQSSGLIDCKGGSFPLPATGDVDWILIHEEMRKTQGAANAECEERYPDIVPYIGTRSTVRDLEELRKAIGDQKLTYWGTSYGTRIGYVYAHDYPGQVRAMLLTSPINPDARSWIEFAYPSALAPDNALGFFFDVFTGMREKYERCSATLDVRELELPSGNVFTRWNLRATLGLMSVSESNYRAIAEFIDHVDAALHGDGEAVAVAIAALDEATEPLFEGWINGGSIPFIGCSDYAIKPDAEEQLNLAMEARAKAPISGWMATQGLYYCTGMTFTVDPVPVNFVNRNTPLLIMGSTYDSLTSYQWALDVTEMFRNSRLVTYEGATHTPFLAGSECVDRYGIDYLVRLIRPAKDVTCPNTLNKTVQ